MIPLREEIVAACEVRGLPVTSGDYLVSVSLGDLHEIYDSKVDALRIRIGKSHDDELGRDRLAVGNLDWPATWRAAPAVFLDS